jgi:hypothetical protein
MCGCSSFDRNWKSAAQTWQPTGHTDLTGPWIGTWRSAVNGHNGALRCLIARTGEYTYHARFAATYWNVFHFGYEFDLAAEPHLDQLHFDGSANLGSLAGGVYEYDGQGDSTEFHCTYHSQYDHGQFDMTRPEAQ